MDSNIVKAFRQRLVRNGYTNVTIRYYGQGLYSVFCRPPSCVGFVKKFLRPSDMACLPRTVFFDDCDIINNI